MGITSNGNQIGNIKLSKEELDKRAEEYKKDQKKQGAFITLHDARTIVIREHAESLRSSTVDNVTERRKIHADARQQANVICQRALEYKGQQANLGINISMVDAVYHVRKQMGDE